MLRRTERTNWTTETSPCLKARIAGALYLIVIIAGAFHYGFVRSAMVVSGDASTTAANILKNELFYRLGFVAAIILLCCNVPVALIFYELFKVVNRILSALVAMFILVATAIETANLLNFYTPLILLGGRYQSGFNSEQLQFLAYMILQLQAIGFNVAVVFFAFYDLVIGYLVLRSSFLARMLGFLMAIGGLCYLTNSFANFLSPGFAARLVPYIQLPSGVAELSFCLWLLVIGVNVPKWEKQASAAQ
jgi:hypothetical protein